MSARPRQALTFTERPLSALDAIYVRRSVRSYLPKRVARTTVGALLNAAVQAPTAMLEQPWVFTVIQDATVLDRLSDLAKEIWARESGHAELAARFASHEDSVFYDATTLVVVGARRTDSFAIGDCWLAAQNLMLAACALGLGTCVIGSALGALNTPEGKALAGIPADVTAVAPIIVGIPRDVATPPVQRRDPEIATWR